MNAGMFKTFQKANDLADEASKLEKTLEQMKQKREAEAVNVTEVHIARPSDQKMLSILKRKDNKKKIASAPRKMAHGKQDPRKIQHGTSRKAIGIDNLGKKTAIDALRRLRGLEHEVPELIISAKLNLIPLLNRSIRIVQKCMESMPASKNFLSHMTPKQRLKRAIKLSAKKKKQ